MPQMSPMWWEFLFSNFIIMMMIMTTIIYHNMHINIYSMKTLKNKITQMNWKW